LAAPVAALGRNQIGKLDRYNAARRNTALQWDQWCRARGYAPATVIASSVPVFVRYPVMVEPERKRDTSWARQELGVDLGLWFKGSIHPAAGAIPGLPQAARAVASCVNLPCLLE
jgi:hypothetical protein